MSLLLLDDGYRASRDWRFAALGYLPPEFIFARVDAATCATYRDSSGVRQTAAADVARFDHDINGNPLGLLMEESRTNFLLNSTAPATQTTGSLTTGAYTLWMEGSGSVEVAANSATITGAGTAAEGSPVVFTVTGAGTVDVTVTGTVTAFQVEKGPFASTLIVTAGATATRAADTMTLSTLTPWYRQAEGTLLAEWALQGIKGSGNYCFAALNDGSNANRIELYAPGATPVPNMVVTAGNAGQSALNAGAAATAGEAIRSAVAWRTDDFNFSARGELATLDSEGTVPTVDRLMIGKNAGAAAIQGWIRRVAYWPKRLPDSTLQGLTR